MYFWGAAYAAAASLVLAARVRPRLAQAGPLRTLDRALMALLAGIGVQLVPLPAALVGILSPARIAFLRESSLGGNLPAFLPLTLDSTATVHAWLAALAACLTFWTARSLFRTGGMRTLVTALAWGAVVLVMVTFAQSAAGTDLVYGVWRPRDAGARPLGPFINRNHAGTWSLLALFLCLGCLQWRRSVRSPSRGWSWRARLAHALDGRSLVLVLAIVLLVVGIATGASRSAMLGLAAGALYLAAVAPHGAGGGRSGIAIGAVALVGALGVVAYADIDRLLARLDETRSLGLAHRVSIWRDSLGILADFPLAGVGAGNFATAMRLYQTTDRTYFWNEAHNHYLQLAAEGGLLLAVPAATALVCLAAAGVRQLRQTAEHVHWMRLGAAAALLAAALQSVWETGLTLPANNMLAAVAAAVLVHHSRHSHAPSGR